MKKAKDIDEYISTFPAEIQAKLEKLRATIRKAAPGSAEMISYAMPAFYQDGVLVYFAAYANHTGFYPTGSGIEKFKDKLKDYKTSKGAVQFPHDKPIPHALVSSIVKFRVRQTREKLKAKNK